MAKRDLCITFPFAQFLRQAQLLILEISDIFLWSSASLRRELSRTLTRTVKIFVFLELEHNWTFCKDLYSALYVPFQYVKKHFSLSITDIYGHVKDSSQLCLRNHHRIGWHFTCFYSTETGKVSPGSLWSLWI